MVRSRSDIATRAVPRQTDVVPTMRAALARTTWKSVERWVSWLLRRGAAVTTNVARRFERKDEVKSTTGSRKPAGAHESTKSNGGVMSWDAHDISSLVDRNETAEGGPSQV